MKKTIIYCLVLALLQICPTWIGVAFSQEDSPAVSGEILDGYRVVTIPETTGDVVLTVYRGDYIKFRISPSVEDPILNIPDLGVDALRLPADLAETPYIKMKESGEFGFSVGSVTGRIVVIDYREAHYAEISSKEAPAFIERVKPLILDVRTKREYKTGHIEGSTLIPVQELQKRMNELSAFKEKDILLYCATGNRSTVAAKLLIDGGFMRITNMRQGIKGWVREKYPVVK